MRGTGLDSPLWIGNWIYGKAPDNVADVPPNPPSWPFGNAPRPTFKFPKLDAEDRRWLWALAALVACFAASALLPLTYN